MKLLLDQGLPRTTAALLRAQGIDAVHVGEIGLAAAADALILEQGRRDGRVVVTLDADFYSSIQTHPLAPLAACPLKSDRAGSRSVRARAGRNQSNVG